MAKRLYDDGIYTVTSAIVATPRRFYPLANTTASIRRDPLWCALGVTAFSAACVTVYGDLLRPVEIAALFGVVVVSLVVGWNIEVLRIDAIGHPRAMIIGHRICLKKIYRAIRDTRCIDRDIFLDSENIDDR